MKKALLLFGVLFCISLAQAQPDDGPGMGQPLPEPPPSSLNPLQPSEVLQAFVQAFSAERDFNAASLLVEGGQTGEALRPVMEELAPTHNGWKFAVLRSDVNIKDDIATAKVMLVLQHRLFGKMMHQERLTLRQTDNEWKIVPFPADEVYRSYRDYADSDILANIATYLARPQEIQEARAYQCLSNLKQMALGIMQFLQDHEEKFALNNKTFEKLIWPYTHSTEIYHCPDDEGNETSYSFNPQQENVALGQMEEPTKTVMLYEGKDGQLDFRHNNRASVCFADGHCELVSPEQAQTLRWEP